LSTLGPVSALVSDTMFRPGRWVWLEPGMSLFAKPGGAPEFAVIRKRTMAYQRIPAGRTDPRNADTMVALRTSSTQQVFTAAATPKAVSQRNMSTRMRRWF
jgi:hypothetical protein